MLHTRKRPTIVTHLGARQSNIIHNIFRTNSHTTTILGSSLTAIQHCLAVVTSWCSGPPYYQWRAFCPTTFASCMYSCIILITHSSVCFCFFLCYTFSYSSSIMYIIYSLFFSLCYLLCQFLQLFIIIFKSSFFPIFFSYLFLYSFYTIF